MTTINSYSVGLGLNPSAMISGAKLARNEMSFLTKALRSVKTDADVFNDGVNIVTKAMENGTIGVTQYLAVMQNLENKYKVSTAAAQQAAEAQKYYTQVTEMDAHVIARNNMLKQQAAEAARFLTNTIEMDSHVIARNTMLRQQAMATEQRLDRQLREGLATRRSVMTGEERHSENMRNLSRQLQMATINQETYNRAVQQSIGIHMQASEAEARSNQVRSQRWQGQGPQNGTGLQAAGMAMGGTGGMLLGMGAKLAVPVGIGLAVKETLSLASAVEQAQAKFDVLSGSVETASAMVMAMKKLDAESPLNFMAIQRGASTTMQYGMANTEVLPMMRAMGEITGGNSERFERMALALGQVTAATKLTGQENLQLINAGFNPLTEIARTTGKSMKELKDMMKDGAVSAQMVKDAFISATAEGGRFHGMMDRINKTGEGQWNKTISDLQKIGVEIGEGIMPVAVQLLGIFRDVLPVLTPVVGLIKLSGTGIGLIASFAHDLVSDTMTVLNAIFTGDYSKPIGQFSNFNGMMEDVLARQHETLGVITDQEGATNAVAVATNEQAEAIKKVEEAQKAINKAKEDAKSAYESELVSMQKIIDKNSLTEEAYNRKNRLQQGMNAQQIAELEQTEKTMKLVQSVADARKKQEDQAKKSAEEHKKITDDITERSKSLIEKYNPLEKVKKDLADLKMLLDVKAIDNRTFQMEQKRVLSEAAKDQRDAIRSPASIDVGSQEDYKILIESQANRVNDQLQQQKEQTLLMKVSVDVQKEANRLMQEFIATKPQKVRP